MFTEYEGGLRRRAHLVDPLPTEEAKDFLLQGCANRQFKDIEEDVEKILKICKGVPLVLKIFRGHFRKQGYSAEKRSQIIEALETGKDVKHEGLSKHLTDFVYDQFQESTQQAFLDICCFFNDWNPDQVECIVGAQELTSLEEAAFVERSSKKELIVHDIIRERARNKSKSTRIMDMESQTDAVAKEQGLEHIRGVRLVNKGESEYVLEIQHLKAMRMLRVLVLEDRIRVNGGSHLTFEELRFFRVRGDIPSLSLNLKGLPKLAFYEGLLFKEGISMYKSPKELEVVKAGSQSDIKNCPVLEMSSEEEDFKLKMLTLKGWDQMVELSENVCGLRLLKYLRLEGCTSLQCLPESFGQLRGLVHLNLSDCESLQYLPQSFCQLSALKHLDLASCSNLQSLPESFCELSALKHLDLASCSNLQSLPESFGQLKALPESFGQLKALAMLSLSKCISLKGLPSTFVDLKALNYIDVTLCPAKTKLSQIQASFKRLVTVEDTSDMEQLVRRIPNSVPDPALASGNNAAQMNSYKIEKVYICRLCDQEYFQKIVLGYD